MRAVTAKPIKLIGTGEKWDALEDFHPQRIAGRILGMGDVVSLVEKAAQTIDMEKAQAIAQKMRKGEFDLEDLSDQLKQMEKLGGMSSMMGMLPGIGKMKKQIDSANLDDRILKRQRAIISSMTPKERRIPKILDGKRKRRIAAGSGTKVEEVNKLLKMHRGMADMMKAMGGAKRGPLAGLANALGMGAGMPGPEEMAKLAEKMPGGLPGGLPKLRPGMPAAPPFPGAPLVLTRGEPTEITVINQLKEQTAVHWHGIELESYNDGVPGWSGDLPQVTPPIPPGGSFVARMTPPRAGTFIYHTHWHDVAQLTSGLYGPLIVLEPGQKFDPAVDKTFVIGRQGPDETGLPLILNGTAQPRAMVMKLGTKYRLRFINMGTNDSDASIALLDENAKPVQWRAICKDGWTLPAAQAEMRPAIQPITVGETHAAFYLADVSGHGAASAFVTAILSTLVAKYRQAFADGGDQTALQPAELLVRLDRDLAALELGKHVSLFYGVLELGSGRLRFANAGLYPFPLVAQGTQVRPLETAGRPLGLPGRGGPTLLETDFPPAARLLAITDGVLELGAERTHRERREELADLFARSTNVDDIARGLGLVHGEGAAPLRDDVALFFLQGDANHA